MTSMNAVRSRWRNNLEKGSRRLAREAFDLRITCDVERNFGLLDDNDNRRSLPLLVASLRALDEHQQLPNGRLKSMPLEASDSPSVSVVVPTYDDAGRLGDALASIATTTLRP